MSRSITQVLPDPWKFQVHSCQPLQILVLLEASPGQQLGTLLKSCLKAGFRQSKWIESSAQTYQRCITLNLPGIEMNWESPILIYIMLQNSSIFTFQTVSSSKASFVTSGRSSLVIAFKALATAKKGAFLHKSVANPNTFTDHAFLTRSFLLSCCRSRLDVAVFPYFSFASDKKEQNQAPEIDLGRSSDFFFCFL